MKVFKTSEIKNIVLLGAPKSGKTTLAETMLFEGGIIKRRGTVEDRNTVSDFHELEKERGNSIFSSLLHTEWRGQKINILDTPGFDDFIGETSSALHVADTGILLLNAHYGVEVGTELIWRQAENYKLPLILAINQLDHEKSDFDKTLEQAQANYGNKVILMQYPLNQGPGFNGIIDLLKMKYYRFSENGGKPEKLPIPESEKAKAEELHNQLVEKAAENDEKLMELYFEKGTLSEDEMRQGLKIGILQRDVFPVFCLSAKQNMGSGRMMGFIGNVVPTAADMPAPKMINDFPVKCDAGNPAILFVFKTQIEPHAGDVTYFKVLCGEVSAGADLYVAGKGHHERISQLYVCDGKNRHPVSKLMAGDIGVTLKLKHVDTNDTLASKNGSMQMKQIAFPEPRMRTAIVARNKNEEEKLAEALQQAHREDPTLIIEFSRELKQTLIHAQGELQLAMLKWRLEHNHKLESEFEEPRIPYRETIQKSARSFYRHKKQSGGAGQFAEVHMYIEPHEEGRPDHKEFPIRGKEEIELPWGGKLVFYTCIVGGVIDQKFLPSILKGIQEKMTEGPITGSHVRDIRVYVHDGKMHPVDSNDISFKIAGMMAFKEAFYNASPKLLEPVYEVSILVPEECLGDVITDIQGRRAIILGIDAEGTYQKIVAHIPLAELYKYATSLRSLTQGRGSHSRKFFEYLPVPSELQHKLMKDHLEVAEA